MKKSLSLAILLFIMFGKAMAQDKVASVILGAETGTAWTMAIGLDNTTDYVAFQMDIKLPDGATVDGDITATKRLKDGDTASLTINSVSTTESTNFVVDSNLLPGNTLRIVGYNFGNHDILSPTNLNDCIMQIPLKTTEDVGYKTLSASISNILFIKQDKLEKETFADITEVPSSIFGDVNYDGKYDIEDINAIIDLRNNKKDKGINIYAADVNNDGAYDIEDINGIIDLRNKK